MGDELWDPRPSTFTGVSLPYHTSAEERMRETQARLDRPVPAARGEPGYAAVRSVELHNLHGRGKFDQGWISVMAIRYVHHMENRVIGAIMY